MQATTAFAQASLALVEGRAAHVRAGVPSAEAQAAFVEAATALA